MSRYYAKCNGAFTLFESRAQLDRSSAMKDHPGQEVVEIPDYDPMVPPRLRKAAARPLHANAKPSKLCVSFITGEILERDRYNLKHNDNEDLHPVDEIFGARKL